MIIDYENKKLREFFETGVKKLEVDEEYKPIIVDILLRRATEFELSNEEIKQDVESLIYNLRSIKVRKFSEKYKNTAGLYDPIKKRITISRDCVLNQDKEVLYEILTHEIFHALTFDKYGNDRLESINRYTNNPNNSLLEAIVEKAANRCVYPKKKAYRPYFNPNIVAYKDITFITDALEAVYGVTEKEFLKNGIMGRNRLAEFLSQKIGESQNETLAFLDEVEVNYSLLHNTLYPHDNRTIAKKDEANNIMMALTGIYRSCEKKMCTRLENMPIKGIRQMRNFMHDIEFDHNRLKYVMDYEIKLLQHSQKYEIYKDIEERITSYKDETIRRINDTNSILDSDLRSMSPEQRKEFLEMAKSGRLLKDGIQKLYNSGIYLSRVTEFSENQGTVQKHLFDDFSDGIWNNDKITKYTKSILEKKGKISFIEKTKYRLEREMNKLRKPKKFKYRKPKSNQKSVYRKGKTYSKFHTLTGDELEDFNKRTDKVIKDKQAHEKRSQDIKEEEKD